MVVGVVVIGRNEEEGIANTINSIHNQTVGTRIVFVDDGSIDNTLDNVPDCVESIVHLPYHKESWIGLPKLAKVFNAGFKEFNKNDRSISHIMISGADCFYSTHYLKILMDEMFRNNTVVASGTIVFEPDFTEPRGSGRLITRDFFKEVGFKYPEKYGFESWLIFKLKQMGRQCHISTTGIVPLRPTKRTLNKSYLRGVAMRCFQYNGLYAFGRLARMIKSPLHMTAMGWGYYFPPKDVKPYTDKDLIDYIQDIQTRRMKGLIFDR